MKKRNIIKNLIMKNKSGSTSVIIICSSLIVILMSAVLADIGSFSIGRYKLGNVAESTARFAAKSIILANNDTIAATRAYALEKDQELSEFKANISDDRRTITVHVGKPFRYAFLKIFGYKGRTIYSQCTAKLSNTSSYDCIRPFAVAKDAVEFGKEVKLKRFTGTNKDGDSYAPLALNGKYRNNIIFGYLNKINLNDTLFLLNKDDEVYEEKQAIDTLIKRCNDKSSCTYENYDADCSRIIILPVVDKLSATREAEMKVIGFTAFFIKECLIENDVQIINGRFIKHVVRSDSSDGINDFGLMSMKIIKQ